METTQRRPTPVGFDTLPVLDLQDEAFRADTNGHLAEIRKKGLSHI